MLDGGKPLELREFVDRTCGTDVQTICYHILD
jgi:hypothetical protein